MARVDDILAEKRRNPKNVRFGDLCQVCDFYFGAPRQAGGSHRIYKTPWQGDPRVNIQEHQGMSKPYQVRQALKAIDKLEKTRDSTE